MKHTFEARTIESLLPAMAIWVAASMLIGCAADSQDEAGRDGESGGQGGGDGTSESVTTNGTGGTGGDAGTGWPGGCDAFVSDTCGDCLETKCCAETEACMEDSDCAGAVTGQTPTGASNPFYAALATCVATQCGPAMEFHPGSDCGGEQPCYDYDRWIILDNPCHLRRPSGPVIRASMIRRGLTRATPSANALVAASGIRTATQKTRRTIAAAGMSASPALGRVLAA